MGLQNEMTIADDLDPLLTMLSDNNETRHFKVVERAQAALRAAEKVVDNAEADPRWVPEDQRSGLKELKDSLAPLPISDEEE